MAMSLTQLSMASSQHHQIPLEAQRFAHTDYGTLVMPLLGNSRNRGLLAITGSLLNHTGYLLQNQVPYFSEENCLYEYFLLHIRGMKNRK